MADPRAFHHAGRPLFFAFVEGQFGYDCRGCGAPCCREVGMIFATERQRDLIERPEWRALVVGEGAGLTHLEFGPGGCPALGDDGLCRVHAEHGRRAKPAPCAMFPFSRLVDAGAFVAVAPNLTFVCPIRVDALEGDERSSYEQIAGDLRAFYGEATESFAKPRLPTRDAVTFELETRVLETVNGERGRASLAEALAAASGREAAELRGVLERALALIELAPRADDPESAAPVLPLVPTLRTALYDLTTEQLDLAMLLAWQLVRQELERSGAEPTPRAIAESFQANVLLAGTLARLDRPVRLDDSLRHETGGDPEADLETMLVLRDIERAPGRVTLRELVERHAAGASGRRAAVLRALSRAGLVFE